MTRPISAIRALLVKVCIVLFAFGVSAVGKAAQKVKRVVKAKRAALKSSYLAYLTAKAWGYFHPSWKTEASAPASYAAEIISDPAGRIEKEFRVPGALRGRVAFWIDVYSRFTSHYRIVHDRDNPELVYGYIDLRPLYRVLPPKMAASKAYQMEKTILKELKARLSEAMELTHPRQSHLAPGDKETLRALMERFGAKDKEQAQVLLRRIRTQTGQRDHFLKAIERSAKLLPEIEAIFREKGLPLALARLPFVESSFNPRAVSKSGALGMWQFMPDTARLFDRQGTRREWAEPIRQSRSAARMFIVLKEKLGDWGIAVTAYNSGAARLRRIVDKYGADDVEELLEIPPGKETLGFAGRNFFCELLAANLVEAYRDRIFSGAPSVAGSPEMAALDTPSPKASDRPAKAKKRKGNLKTRTKTRAKARAAANHRSRRTHKGRRVGVAPRYGRRAS